MEYQKPVAYHIRSNRKQITNLSNMVLKPCWMHLSQKFCLFSSDWRISVSRPAHLRIWHIFWDLSTPNTLAQPDCTAQAWKSTFHRLHQPQLTAWVFFSGQTDGRALSSGQRWSTHGLDGDVCWGLQGIASGKGDTGWLCVTESIPVPFRVSAHSSHVFFRISCIVGRLS
jgi:hypothetical protein